MSCLWKYKNVSFVFESAIVWNYYRKSFKSNFLLCQFHRVLIAYNDSVLRLVFTFVNFWSNFSFVQVYTESICQDELFVLVCFAGELSALIPFQTHVKRQRTLQLPTLNQKKKKSNWIFSYRAHFTQKRNGHKVIGTLLH